MAIQIDISESKFGVPFAGAYFRICETAISRQREGGEHKFVVRIDIAGYGTSAPTDETHHVDFRRYFAPLDDVEAHQGAEFLAKCYEWVSGLPEMEGAQAA